MYKLVEERYIFMLEEMGFSKEEILRRIKKRLILTVSFFALFMSGLLFFNHWILIVVAFFSAVFIYKADFLSLKGAFNRFAFKRELEAAKFMQLIAPILFEDKGEAPLSAVLSRLLVRVDSSLQRSLFQFMNEISSNPNDITPFKDFAKRTSSQDIFLNFMIALYDYQNSTADVTVLKELSEIANETMLEKVNEVIEIKNNSVSGVFNTVAISLSLFMIPYIICLIIYKMKESNLDLF